MATVTVISWYLKFKTRECKHRSATHAMPNALMPLKSKSNIQTSFLEFIIIFLHTPAGTGSQIDQIDLREVGWISSVDNSRFPI
jgi:hypothetical protein